MNRLSADPGARVIGCLLEGCSIRATCRLTGAAKKTVMRLLVEAGEACAEYHDQHARALASRRIKVDEIWTFNYCKRRNVTPEIAAKHPDAGDRVALVRHRCRQQVCGVVASRTARPWDCVRFHARPFC